MNALTEVPFDGDVIQATQTPEGRIFVSLRRMCENLGIDHSGQLQKLKTTEWANVEIISTIDNSGRQFEMAMLDAESVPMWLVTISTTKVAVHVRPKLNKYQKEVKEVLYRYFVGDRDRPDSKIVSMVGRLGEKVDRFSERQEECIALLSRIHPRKAITKSVRSRHISVLLRSGCMCPCCHQREVVDPVGQAVGGAEFDHFHGPHRNGVDETWLVCRQCNLDLRFVKFHTWADTQFRAYQARLERMDRPVYRENRLFGDDA